MLKKSALGLMAAGAMFAVSAGAAQARVCSPVSVTGVGKPSITAPGARLSARTAWRYAVVSRKGLGARYAVLRLAARASHSCRAVGKRTICRYSATPCRL